MCVDGDPHLFEVPALESASGSYQMERAMRLIEEYDLKLDVIGLCFETTSSNTGIHRGALTRITNEIGHYLLLLACRHHVTELRMVHFWKEIAQDKT